MSFVDRVYRVVERMADPSRLVTRDQLDAANFRAERALEAMQDLVRDARGWDLLVQDTKLDLTLDGRRKISVQGRMMGIANALIKRGREVRHAYVWGQGVEISAKDPAVNDVIQAFLDDESNRESFSGAQARQVLEGELYDEGNSFFAHFTDPLTGRVQVRAIPYDEIVDVYTDPEDTQTPWYYLRTWSEWTENGQAITRQAAYPALKYQPVARPRTITYQRESYEVIWDAPVRHIRVNAGRGKFGIGDSYAALPWAVAYKEFQEDWAKYMKAISRIAFMTTSKSRSAAQQKRAELSRSLEAGSTVNMTEDQTLQAVGKSGATLDAESARPIASLVASAVGLPVTILLSDPGQTGARATAETLDLPTRLTFQARQELHTEAILDTLQYVLEAAVLAPRGELRGVGARQVQDGDRLKVIFPDAEDSTVEVVWPSLESTDALTLVDAIVKASDLSGMPPEPLLTAALQALGIRNVDEIMQAITDDSGKLLAPPSLPADNATRAFRQGQDPNAVL